MLQGKTAIITGCNRGLGQVLMETFAQNGANVWAHARCFQKEFENKVKVLSEQYNVEIRPIYFDLQDFQAIKDGFETIRQSKCIIDILINNAGVSHGSLFQLTKIEQIKKVYDINLFAALELTQHVYQMMSRQKKGSIINIASIFGIDTVKGNCAYGTSKAALLSATKVLALEFASRNVRVNAIAPGPMEMGMIDTLNEKALQMQIEATALKRLGSPLEIAEMAVFLGSNKASYITGQVIRVDGGTF